MSAIKFLPAIFECLANTLAFGIDRRVKPNRSHLESQLLVFSHLEFTSMKGSLALWPAGMKTARIVNSCPIARRLIKDVEQIILDEEPR
jgi:hypothetical protein